jgi:hypothetical protein
MLKKIVSTDKTSPVGQAVPQADTEMQCTTSEELTQLLTTDRRDKNIFQRILDKLFGRPGNS